MITKLYTQLWGDNDKEVYCYLSDLGEMIIECHGNKNGTLPEMMYIVKKLVEHNQDINQILFVCCFPAQVGGHYGIRTDDSDYGGNVWSGIANGHLITARNHAEYLERRSTVKKG
jgi:hypothetical protein